MHDYRRTWLWATERNLAVGRTRVQSRFIEPAATEFEKDNAAILDCPPEIPLRNAAVAHPCSD
jgi:hypothetical protein